jgi:uncharacterized protein (DUF302 family)
MYKQFVRYGVRFGAAAAVALAAVAAQAQSTPEGIVKVRSAYSVPESVERIKQDIAAKGILYFSTIDQAALAAKAGVPLRPSSLLIFGNPPLGTTFITARGEAGLDWPVRLLVQEDEQGRVWAIYNDFGWIARRHGITNRDEQFATASKVIASITASVAEKK